MAYSKEKQREYMKIYNQTDKAKQAKKDYYATTKGKKAHRDGLKRYFTKYKGIYACFDSTTSECLYIGASSAVNNRINIHRYAINNLDKAAQHRPTQIELYTLLSQHNGVFFEILDECDKKTLSKLEQFYISIYQPKYNKYNYDKL